MIDCPIIDSHIHLVDIRRPEGVLWPKKESPLYRDWTLENYNSAVHKIRIKGAILVETGGRDADNEWLLRQSELALILGVVGNLDPLNNEFELKLKAFAKHPKALGLRIRPVKQYDLCSAELAGTLAKLEGTELTVELGTPSVELIKDYESLIRKLPRQRFILDHGGHPDLSPEFPQERWLNAMKLLAKADNLYVKMTDQGGAFAKTSREIANRYLQIMENYFGIERLFFGSNWPPSSLHGELESLLKLYFTWLGDRKQAPVQFFYKNVNQAYPGLNLSTSKAP
ncbi:MAG: amidohydrolase family protein [Opitutales bacterium]|nr:amidohydrolase family protein [Opitutales bacterium]